MFVACIFSLVNAGNAVSTALVVKRVDALSVSCLFNVGCKSLKSEISSLPRITFKGDNFLKVTTVTGGPGSPAAGLYAYEYRFNPAGIRRKGVYRCIRSFTIPFGPVVSTLDFDGDKIIGDEVFVIKESGFARRDLISADQDTNGNITFKLDSSDCLNSSGKNRSGAYSIGIVSTNPPVTTRATVMDARGAIRIISIPAPQLPAECAIPEYDPFYWNDCDGVCGNKYCPCGAGQCDYCEDCGDVCGTAQCNNNCYNYATNRRTDTFAKPGCGAGSLHADITCASIINAALADGLAATTANESCSGGRHKVALVVWPGSDYHWYRRDLNGTWSHKPGKHEATNVDNSNQPIANPETADRGNYTDFCGYFCACSDVPQGQGRERVK